MDVILTLLLLLWFLKKRTHRMEFKRKRKARRFKTRFIFRNRQLHGEMNLVKQMYTHDAELFYRSFRMNIEQFDYLLYRLGPSMMTKIYTHDTISARQRLAMTIRSVLFLHVIDVALCNLAIHKWWFIHRNFSNCKKCALIIVNHSRSSAQHCKWT